MKKILGFLAFIIALVLLAFASTFFIKVKEIECKSQFGPCSSFIENELAGLGGIRLNSLPFRLKQVLTSQVLVENYSWHLISIDKVLITVIEKKPIFAIKTLETFALIDKDGIIISFTKETNLPYIIYLEVPTSLGQKVPNRILFMGRILGDLFSQYQLKEAQAQDHSFAVNFSEKLIILFPDQGDKEKILGTLKLILSRLKDTSDLARIRLIDLRFKNPIVK